MAAGSTYTPIATQTLGSNQTQVTFSSIPSTYTDIVLIKTGAQSAAPGNMTLRFNSDTGTNYSGTQIFGNGSSALSDRYSNQNTAYINFNNTTSASVLTRINIMNYANTTTFKTVLVRNDDAGSYASAFVHLWRKTPEAINRIDLYGPPDLLAGSTFTLYGIVAA